MPHKDIEAKRAVWRKWARTHKRKKTFKDRARNAARRAHPVRKMCSAKGCPNLGQRHHTDYEKPKEIVWLCSQHHAQEHRQGNGLCTFPGCGRPHRAKGFCVSHWEKWRKAKT